MKVKLYVLSLIIFLSACSPVKKILQGGKIQQISFTEKIPFTFDYGIPFIKVTIGEKVYNFMFDTGAPTVITPEIAKVLGLKPNVNQKVSDSQGASNVQSFVTIPNLKIGNLNFENTGAVIIASSNVFEFECMKYDGIIGANLMAKAIWQIDYQNKILTATNSLDNLTISSTTETIDFIPKKGQLTPLVPIKIGKKTAYATFDTGATGDFNLALHTYKTEVENFKAVESSGSSISGIYGKSLSSFTKHINVPTLALGEIRLHNQIIDFHQQASNLVGNLFLKNYIVILNWDKNKIYMIKQSDYDVTKLQTYGFMIKYINNKPKVIKIYQNSEAEKAGILINDELISFNGKDLSNLNELEACFYAFNSILKTKENTADLILLRAGKKVNITLKKTTLLD